jgi:hypothetical protein
MATLSHQFSLSRRQFLGEERRRSNRSPARNLHGKEFITKLKVDKILIIYNETESGQTLNDL